jgi:phage anti-repressor protein
MIKTNNLTVIENGLVPVYTTHTGEKVVDGRELWTSLNSKQDFSTWVKKRFDECEAVENQDYTLLHKKMEQVSGAKHMIEYMIKLATAKEMAMLERNEVGKSVRKYFISIEEKYKQQAFDLNQLSPELQAIFIQDKKIRQVETRVGKLENTMTVDYGQQVTPKEIVNKTAVHFLGGKNSPAYKQIGQKVFQAIWRAYKNRFGITSYRDTPATKYDDAKNYLSRWMPDYNLLLEIQDANSRETA